MLAILLTGLLLGSAPPQAPEPTYDEFLGATRLKNQQWADGAAFREARNWAQVAPRNAARAREVARAEPDPSRKKALLGFAERYERGAKALKRIDVDERKAHEQRCQGSLDALEKAYASAAEKRAPALAATYPHARRCAEAYGALVERLEDANQALRKLHREVFDSRLLREIWAPAPPP